MLCWVFKMCVQGLFLESTYWIFAKDNGVNSFMLVMAKYLIKKICSNVCLQKYYILFKKESKQEL